MIVNFAERAHNHNWELDPVTRSLLDTDFYKLLMLQFIWKHYPRTRVSFSLFNRLVDGPSGHIRSRGTGRAVGLHARELRFRRSELVWLAGNTFMGGAEFLSQRFWNGWSGTSDYRITNSL